MIINLDSLNLLKEKVFVTDLEIGERVTAGGIIIADDNGKSDGVRSRWAKVIKTGPDQKVLKPGMYVLMDHGRWTRNIEVSHEGKTIKVNMIDYPTGVLAISDTAPKELEMIRKD